MITSLSKIQTLAVITVALLAVAAAPALALDHHWNVSSGNWGAASNWNPQSVPGASDIVYVDFFANGLPGTATVNQTQTSPISVTVMNGDTVGITGNAINSGSLGVGGDFIVGYGGTHGTLNVINPMPGINPYHGNVTVGNTMRIGLFSGVGTVTQNDGTVNINQLLRVADSNSGEFTSSGVYNLSGSGVVNAARLDVGYGGDDDRYPLMNGTFNLSGGTLNVALGAQIPDPHIGGGGSTGVVNQSGGVLNCPNRIIELGDTNGSGVYNFSGGTLNAAGISIGNTGTINYNLGSEMYVGQLSTVNGHVNLSSSGSVKTLRASLLFVSPGAWKIDLSDNAMIVNALLGENMRSMISRGYNGGPWTGNGITSSPAANRANSPHKTALGYDNLGTSGTTNVRYTYFGDANLDLKVDLTDFTFLAADFNGANRIWTQGDFNYDGNVNLTDFTLLASNFNQTLAAAGASPGAVVPEPATLVFGIAGFIATRRTRRALLGR